MLVRCKELLEYTDRGGIAIDESMVGTKLTTALRIAVENGEGRIRQESNIARRPDGRIQIVVKVLALKQRQSSTTKA